LTEEELTEKFIACARRSLTEAAASRALAALRNMESMPDIHELTELLAIPG
jgi:hypothetical protein